MSAEQSTIASEEWRPVPFAEGYEVSDLGRVRSRRSINGLGGLRDEWRIVTGSTVEDGYQLHRFQLADGTVKQMQVHRLVGLVFIGPPPFPGAEVRHWDGDPGNNRLTNLLYGTRKENAADQERHGTRKRGEKVETATLTNDQVREIAAMLTVSVPQQEIADRFGVTQAAVSLIALGRTWQSVTGFAVQPVDPNHVKLDGDKAREIVRLRREGVPRMEVARRFGVTLTAVKFITSGRTWSEETGIPRKERKRPA